jgi:hypothetical protein
MLSEKYQPQSGAASRILLRPERAARELKRPFLKANEGLASVTNCPVVLPGSV